MPEVPKVAIITRTRNRPALLRRAIGSVLAQTAADWRHVIVNDGGDRAAVDAMAAEFAGAYAGRLQVLHLAHAGMQAASNTAIRETQSTYIAIHDDDDTWHPDFLAETTAFLDAAGPDSPYQGVISKTLRILERENPDGSFTELERQPYVPLREISLFRIGYENPFAPIAFLYRRAVHDRIGLFDPRWDIAADLDFNFRFLQRHEIGVIDKPLAYYHWRDESASGVNANTVTHQKERHGRILNELKNHYLRQADTARSAAHALAFQLSAYAVENQWMTVEIRERAHESVALLKELWLKLTEDILPRLKILQIASNKLADLQQQLEAVRAFNGGELWPKLAEDIIPRLAQLQAATAQLPELKQQLEAIRAFNGGELWPKLAEDIIPRLAQLQAAAAQLPDLRQQIEAIRAFNGGELWPKLAEDIIPRLAELSRTVTSLWERQPRLTEAILAKLDGIVATQQAAAQARQQALEAVQAELLRNGHELAQVREELRQLREEQHGQWQLGRLQVRWLPKRKP